MKKNSILMTLLLSLSLLCASGCGDSEDFAALPGNPIVDPAAVPDSEAAPAAGNRSATYQLTFSGATSQPFVSDNSSIQQSGFLPANSNQPTAFNAATQTSGRALTVQFGRNNSQPLAVGMELPASNGASVPHVQISFAETGSQPTLSRLYLSIAGRVRIRQLDVAARRIELEFIGIELQPRIAATQNLYISGTARYQF